MPSSDSPPPWLRQLRARSVEHWALKAVFIPLCMGGFFAAYFSLLRHPHFDVMTMPVTTLDRLIPFQPAAMVPYLSLWLYVIVGAGTLRGSREIKIYSASVLLLTAAGLGTFFFWPTATPRPDIDWAHYPSFQFLKNVDASGNACPSLHVAFAIFTAIWLERLLREISAPIAARLLNAAWAVAIAYATIATRQHVTVDVLAGSALGGVAGLLDPRSPGRDLAAKDFWPNRQWLALAISIVTKATIFTLGAHTLSPVVATTLFVLPDGWILLHLLTPNFSGLVPTATRFATTAREAWLTIDDGPEPATTVPMLDLLDRHGAKATFFVIGTKAAAHPELLAEIRRRGHTLGNHTHTHPLATFWLAGPQRTAREIDACDAAMQHSGAPLNAWFRAPAGIKTFFLRSALAQRDRVLIGWTARARENFGAARAAPLRRLTRALQPGAILLLHESAQHPAERVALLAALLEHFSATGYHGVLPRRESLR